MGTRHSLLALAAQQGLSPQQTRQLLQGAQLTAEPLHIAIWLPRGIAVLAATLGGMGVVMWIAANWVAWGRVGHFALLQGLVLATGLGAALRAGARAPLGLLAFLGIGALFAYFGQTYQTGADPWQLFALWAVLALPLCWGARSDVLWAPWVLVALTAIALWTHTYSGYRWSVEPDLLRVHLLAWTATLLLAGVLSPALDRFTCAGPWAFRTAVTLAVVTITTTALGGLFDSSVLPHFYLGLLVLLVAAALLCTPRNFDVFALSAVALGVNALLVCGLVRWMMREGDEDDVGHLLLLGLFAAGLLAASVSSILKLARHYTLREDAAAQAVRDDMSILANAPLQAAIQTGIACGLLPAGIAIPANDVRPWPVLLLTAIGAWFAAIPLMFAVGSLLEEVFSMSSGPYIIGCLALACAVVVLRVKDAPLFLEQLAVPVLLVGGGTLAIGVYRDLHETGGALVMLVAVTSVAAIIRKMWLRVLLGSAAAGLLCQALLSGWSWPGGLVGVLMVLHGLLAAWLVTPWLQKRNLALAVLIEAMATGWLLSTLVGLVWLAGATFLVGAAAGSHQAVNVLMWAAGDGARSWQTYSIQAGSSVLILAAAAVVALAWPGAR